jgi:large subunit ribosomal protein L19
MKKYTRFKLVNNKKIENYSNLIELKKKNEFKNNSLNFKDIRVGDRVKIEYNTSTEENKIKLEIYQGIIISLKSEIQSVTIQRNIKGIIVENIIPLISPRIISINVEKKSKINKSKIYFIKNLSDKQIRNKLKFY